MGKEKSYSRKAVKGQYPYMDYLEFSSGALIQNAFYIYTQPIAQIVGPLSR